MERGKKESALQWALSHFDDHDNILFEISFVLMYVSQQIVNINQL